MVNERYVTDPAPTRIYQPYLLENGRTLYLGVEDCVMPPSPYSMLLANYLTTQDFTGRTILDVGTGSGVLLITAIKQGALIGVGIDINPNARLVAERNAEVNGIEYQATFLEPGNLYEMLKTSTKNFDVIICNPAQLPMPAPSGRANKAYYAGPEGRDMITGLINNAADHLSPEGEIIMTHTSLVNLPQTIKLLEENGFDVSIPTSIELACRDFYRMDYVKELAKAEKVALYHEKDGRYFETVHIIHAKRR